MATSPEELNREDTDPVRGYLAGVAQIGFVRTLILISDRDNTRGHIITVVDDNAPLAESNPEVAELHRLQRELSSKMPSQVFVGVETVTFKALGALMRGWRATGTRMYSPLSVDGYREIAGIRRRMGFP